MPQRSWPAPRHGSSEPRVPGTPSSYEHTAPSQGALPRVLTGVRVLVVDDDPDVLDLFRFALSACGATVTTADNARDALASARAQTPAVVVSDIAMHDEDGYWLVHQLRADASPVVAGVPVIAVTAFGREHSRGRTRQAGFTEHLQKPIDPEQLCRTVARLAGGGG